MVCSGDATDWMEQMRAPLAPNATLTVKDAAELTGFSDRTVIRVFEKKPGFIVLNWPERMHKRRYRSIRIHALWLNGGVSFCV